MKLTIEFDGNVDSEVSSDLQELSQLIQEYDTHVLLEKQKSPLGIKDSGLIIGLTIASLALSAVQTVITVLQYWQSQRPRYNISFYDGNNIYTLNNATKKDFNQAIQKINLLPANYDGSVEIKIYKK